MKVFSRMELRTFCRATEDEDKVKQAVRFAAGVPDEEENSLEITKAEGYAGSPLLIISLVLERQPKIRRFWERLPAPVVREIVETLDDRVDKEAVLHFRLDKENAYRKRLTLTHRGAVISVEAKIVSYPASRVAALASAEEYLKGLLSP